MSAEIREGYILTAHSVVKLPRAFMNDLHLSNVGFQLIDNQAYMMIPELLSGEREYVACYLTEAWHEAICFNLFCNNPENFKENMH